jgi:hypothetical protein
MVPENVAFASLAAEPLVSSNRQLANRSAKAGELHNMTDAMAIAATRLKFGCAPQFFLGFFNFFIFKFPIFSFLQV